MFFGRDHDSNSCGDSDAHLNPGGLVALSGIVWYFCGSKSFNIVEVSFSISLLLAKCVIYRIFFFFYCFDILISVDWFIPLERVWWILNIVRFPLVVIIITGYTNLQKMVVFHLSSNEILCKKTKCVSLDGYNFIF